MTDPLGTNVSSVSNLSFIKVSNDGSFGCLWPPNNPKSTWSNITNIPPAFFFTTLSSSWSCIRCSCRAGVTFDVWTPIVFFYVVVRSRARSVSWTLALSYKVCSCWKVSLFRLYLSVKNESALKYIIWIRELEICLFQSFFKKQDFFWFRFLVSTQNFNVQNMVYIIRRSCFKKKYVSFWDCDLWCVSKRDRESREFQLLSFSLYIVLQRHRNFLTHYY